MFIRFVTPWIDYNSQVAAGIFRAAYWLKYEASLPDYEWYYLVDILDWFDLNLEKPVKLRRSTRPHRPNKAICWFKPSARTHLQKAFELATLLENNAIFIRRIKTTKPGYVVYEDEFQVAAEPFSDIKF